MPTLQRVGDDNAATWGYWKAKDGCTGATQCVYGDTAAIRTVALLGDSHAAMWLPALDWVGLKLGFRLVVLWRPGCPAADVTVRNPSTHSVDTGCNAFRSASLQIIEQLAPALVLTADRTTDVLGADGEVIPTATWRKGLETTLAALVHRSLHVAVIGDVSSLSTEIPECLAAHPRAVQRCSSPNPNPAKRTELAAEEGAAKDESVPYLNPEPWLCTKVCSPSSADTRCTTTGSTCQRRTPPSLASSGRTRSSRCCPPPERARVPAARDGRLRASRVSASTT